MSGVPYGAARLVGAGRIGEGLEGNHPALVSVLSLPTGKPAQLPDYLTNIEADALDSEFSRRGSKVFDAPVRQGVVDAMRAARIRPSMMYAYARTGLLITEASQGGYSPAQLASWLAAVRAFGKAP